MKIKTLIEILKDYMDDYGNIEVMIDTPTSYGGTSNIFGVGVSTNNTAIIIDTSR